MHRRLLQRRCVACGTPLPDWEPFASTSHFDDCPNCGCDFHDRPPRSYAEMEGLLLPSMAGIDVDDTVFFGRRSEENLVHRWLAFLFMAMMMIVLIVCLSAAAVPV